MHVKSRKIRNTIDDSRMSGAVARKRCDPAEKQTVKHVTFGARGAPFPSGRRGPLPDLPTLSKKWGIGSWKTRKITWGLRRPFRELSTLSRICGPGSRYRREFTGNLRRLLRPSRGIRGPGLGSVVFYRAEWAPEPPRRPVRKAPDQDLPERPTSGMENITICP